MRSHLEPIFDGVCDTLTSPRVHDAISKLADKLVAMRVVSADDALETLVFVLASAPLMNDGPGHPLRIWCGDKRIA